MNDPFWKDKPDILIDANRLVEFVPTADMSVNEKLNALTRFFIYVGILLSVVYKSTTSLYIPFIGCILIYIVYEHYPALMDASKSSYQLPTKENPFMNVLLSDYVNNPQRPPAADLDIPAVHEAANHNFAHGLYKDVNNIWDKNNSQRQFYTNPATTIPNDRDSFMKWCWNTPPTCKEGNLTQCLKYEDVRGTR